MESVAIPTERGFLTTTIDSVAQAPPRPTRPSSALSRRRTLKRLLGLALAAFLVWTSSHARAVAQGGYAPSAMGLEGPPVPPGVSTVPGGIGSLVAPAAAAPAGDVINALTAALGLPTIKLGEKRDSVTPTVHGAAQIERGLIADKSAGNTLIAALTGAAHAHAYLFCHANATATYELVQEFEIVPGNPAKPVVSLTMTARLDGYLRSDENGAASLQGATATLFPAVGGTPMSVSFSPASVAGGGSSLYSQKVELPPQRVPAGKYVLSATLVYDATVNGLIHGHGEAVFTPLFFYATTPTNEPVVIVPSLPNNPFDKLDNSKKNYGLWITVQVNPGELGGPEGSPRAERAQERGQTRPLDPKP